MPPPGYALMIAAAAYCQPLRQLIIDDDYFR